MSLRNPFRQFLDLMPARPLQVGTVTAVDGDTATITLPGGFTAQGLPMGFQTSVIAIGVIIIQAALNTLGTEAVAAFTSALRINSMGVMPLMSFGLAMATYTGQNLGAGRPDRILLGVRHGCYLALAYS